MEGCLCCEWLAENKQLLAACGSGGLGSLGSLGCWCQEQALFWQQRSVQCLDYHAPACRWLMDRLLPCPAPLYPTLPPCLPAARR